MKKEYIVPKMEIVKLNNSVTLLADSGANPWWENNQPDEDNWWKGNWGD